MTGQARLDAPQRSPRSAANAIWNRALTAALAASLWYVAIRLFGPWCGLIVTLVPIYFVRETSWRHGLLVITLLVHLAWQIVWMF
jgi:hypothetical protein